MIEQWMRRLAPIVVALLMSAFLLSMAPAASLGPIWLLGVLAVLGILWVSWQPEGAERDDMLPAIAIVISALGLTMLARLSPEHAQKQQLWLLISL